MSKDSLGNLNMGGNQAQNEEPICRFRTSGNTSFSPSMKGGFGDSQEKYIKKNKTFKAFRLHNTASVIKIARHQKVV